MAINNRDDNFQINRIYNIQPNTPTLLEYFRSIVGPDRQNAVAKLTDQLSDIGWKMTPKWRELVHAGEREPASNFQLGQLLQRYNLPVALYRTDGFHWILLENLPQKTSNGWKANVYDPMHPDVKDVVIPDRHMTHPFILVNYPRGTISTNTITSDDDDFKMTATISDNSDSIPAQLQNLNTAVGGYDISIPKFDGELAGLSGAKTAPLQTTESYNCGFWCLAHAAIAWGIKPGKNAFKDKGLRQLSADTGVIILTPEGLI